MRIKVGQMVRERKEDAECIVTFVNGVGITALVTPGQDHGAFQIYDKLATHSKTKPIEANMK